MATYYVDGTNGADTNAGTSAATAWATIDKALTGGMASVSVTNTVYVAPGTYRKHSVATIAPSALQAFIADVDLSQFGGVSGLTAGAVVWTAFETNDTTAPVAFATLDLGGASNLTFQGFTFVGGNANPTCVKAITTNSQSITFQKCSFLGGKFDAATRLVAYAGVASAAASWLVDQCTFFGLLSGTAALDFSIPSNTSAHHDSGITVQNSLFIVWGNNSHGISFASTSTNSFRPRAGVVKNCTILAGGGSGVITDGNWDYNTPAMVYNCLIMSYAYAINSGSGFTNLVEDYNRLCSQFPRNNVTAGANSVAGNTHALLVEVAQWLHDGRMPRPTLMPMAGSPLLGRGNNATNTVSSDFSGRSRPAGGQSTNTGWGYLERHDTAAKETATVDAGVGIVITGPGDHDLLIPVDATSTTIAIKARYDTAGDNTAGNRPQVQLLANGEIGVTAQTVTMTAANNTWETLSLSAFTPTGRGVVTLRLLNRSQAGTGKAFFDSITVT